MRRPPKHAKPTNRSTEAGEREIVIGRRGAGMKRLPRWPIDCYFLKSKHLWIQMYGGWRYLKAGKPHTVVPCDLIHALF